MSDAIRCPVGAHTQRIRRIPRRATGFEYLPKSLAVDLARFDDDRTVIGLRQGRHFKVLAKHSGLDTVAVAERVSQFIQAEKPDTVIVDGDGLGAGVVDQLRHRGCECHEFHGGQPAFDRNMYFNRRAEAWDLMRDWLAAGAQILDDAHLGQRLFAVASGEARRFAPLRRMRQDLLPFHPV